MISRLSAGPARLTLLLTLGLMAVSSVQALSPLLEQRLPSVVLQSPAQARATVLPRTTAPGSVLVLARAGDTGQDIADSYGVDLASLSPSQPGRLPWGAVVRVALPSAATEVMGQLPPGVSTYAVRPGDTLVSIAYRQDLSVTELLSANLGRETLDKLAVGDLLYIPSQPGLLVRIKPGQTVQGLVKTYKADAGAVAKANGIGLPNELGVGDYLLLPGVLATGFQRELLARRERQVEAEKQARVQRQYEKYQAYTQQVKENRLRRQYAVQAQYEKFLAYQKSPARQKLIAQYEAQARYDAAQQAQKVQARAQASVPRTSGSVRSASSASLDGGLSWPLRSYRITSRFGEADIEFHRQYFHGGVDLAAPYGTPIYAAAAGTVTESGSGDYGNDVYTDTGDALVIYGHMSRTAVSVGQRVSRGEVLGYVGCSGMCTGPHLHFEVRLNGRPVDPLGLLP
ncbi:peptidoglycan DD-metalloendopeptidase family protein [Deinococcus sp.]|uniref:peptidoglycan DD-metalloendopeptidase family protein n=1 Tax=Deinococcus sp. TaxID=47478 RepID=UPI003C7EBBA2